MYAYCSGNPVVYADYTGEDAVIIVDYEDLPVVGHAAVFIETPQGWYLTQFCSSTWFPWDAKITMSEPMTYSEMQNYIKKFNSTLYIEGDFTSSYQRARKLSKSSMFHPYNGRYNLFTNNCLHYVTDILSQGEFDSISIGFFVKTNTCIIPSVFFEELRFIDETRKLINAAQGNVEYPSNRSRSNVQQVKID